MMPRAIAGGNNRRAKRYDGLQPLAEGEADRSDVQPLGDRPLVIATYGDRKQAQAVLAQSSYLSVNDRRLHFGIGGETRASLEIRWPNGGRETIPNVAANRPVVIKEGSGIQ
jgi:hypothetical protein